MLGDIRLAPAILFYPLYVVGILVFVGAPATATWQSALLYGALFGLCCYAMFELTSVSPRGRSIGSSNGGAKPAHITIAFSSRWCARET
jgi:Predicted membrane protein (DUF2177)